MNRIICVNPLLIMLSVVSLAADDSLAELSFEDLMDIEVSVASKKSESIYDAPGIITSYNRTDMSNYGRYTLRELADITPGFSGSWLYGEPGFETRGVKASSFNNNRHLVLVDGIPVNHIRANKAPAGEELSLYGMNRVEFLRGPASSLYGTGAYYGVVNIVPAVPELKSTTFKSRTGFGGPIPHRHAEAFAAHRGDKQQFWASASYIQNEPSKTYVGSEKDQNFRYWNDLKAFSAMGSYRVTEGPLEGVGAGTYYLSRFSGLGEHWNGDFSHELNDIRWETFITFLRYDKSVSDMVSFNTYLKHNRSTETGSFTPLSDSGFTNFNGSGELLYHYEVPVVGYEYYFDMNYAGKVIDVTGGIDLDWRYQPGEDGGTLFYYIVSSDSMLPYQAEINPMRRSADFRTGAAFLQVKGELPVLEGLILTGGIRNDLGQGGENSYTQLSPRVGVVQRFTDHLNLKCLYGTALLSPGIKEIMLNEEAKIRAPELTSQIVDISAETFSTLEFGLVFYQTLKSEKNLFNIKAEVGGFVNQSVNRIHEQQGSTSDGRVQNYFSNSNDTVISRGVEAEIRGEADFGIGFLGNYAFAEAFNTQKVVQEDIPVHKINAGITYRSDRIGVYSSLVGRHVVNFTAAGLENSAGFTTADATVGWRSSIGIGAELNLTNITNEIYRLPIGGIPEIPMAQRQMEFSLTAQF